MPESTSSPVMPVLPRELSCSLSAVLLDRVERLRGAHAVARVLDRAGWPHGAEHLRDLANWIPYDTGMALLEAGAAICDDQQLPADVGRDFVACLAGSGNAAVLRTLGAPERLLEQMDTVAKRFSAVSDFAAIDMGPGHALLHRTMAPGASPSRTHCRWTAGLLTQTTVLFGLPPADVEELRCQCDGAESCEFAVRWTASLEPHLDPELRAAALADQVDAMASRLQDVFDTAADLIGSGDLDGTLRRIADRAGLQVRAPRLLLAVHGTGDEVHCHHHGFEEDEVEQIARRALAGHALPAEWLAVPVASSRRVYGALVAAQVPGTGFFDHERQLLEVYARYAATALDTATALAEAKARQEEAQRRYDESRALLELARHLAGAASSTEVAARLAHAIPEVVDCDRVSVYVWSDEDEVLELRARISVLPELAEARGVEEFSPGTNERLAGWLRSPDAQPVFLDLGRPEVRAAFGDLRVSASVAVPIATEQRFLGCLIASVAEGPERLAETRELVDRLSGVAAHAIIALENGRLVDQMAHQATHDQLTGVRNRAGFHDELVRTGRRAARDAEDGGFAVFYLDLDGFKPVNDLHGHETGDDLLRAVAQRLCGCVRDGDSVARLGGDEFAVIVAGVESRHDLDLLHDRLRAAFVDPFRLGGRELEIGASIGLARFPEDGRFPEELLRVADAGMYRAKGASRRAGARA